MYQSTWKFCGHRVRPLPGNTRVAYIKMSVLCRNQNTPLFEAKRKEKKAYTHKSRSKTFPIRYACSGRSERFSQRKSIFNALNVSRVYFMMLFYLSLIMRWRPTWLIDYRTRPFQECFTTWNFELPVLSDGGQFASKPFKLGVRIESTVFNVSRENSCWIVAFVQHKRYSDTKDVHKNMIKCIRRQKKLINEWYLWCVMRVASTHYRFVAFDCLFPCSTGNPFI